MTKVTTVLLVRLTMHTEKRMITFNVTKLCYRVFYMHNNRPIDRYYHMTVRQVRFETQMSLPPAQTHVPYAYRRCDVAHYCTRTCDSARRCVILHPDAMGRRSGQRIHPGFVARRTTPAPRAGTPPAPAQALVCTSSHCPKMRRRVHMECTKQVPGVCCIPVVR